MISPNIPISKEIGIVIKCVYKRIPTPNPYKEETAAVPKKSSKMAIGIENKEMNQVYQGKTPNIIDDPKMSTHQNYAADNEL